MQCRARRKPPFALGGMITAPNATLGSGTRTRNTSDAAVIAEHESANPNNHS